MEVPLFVLGEQRDASPAYDVEAAVNFYHTIAHQATAQGMDEEVTDLFVRMTALDLENARIAHREGMQPVFQDVDSYDPPAWITDTIRLLNRVREAIIYPGSGPLEIMRVQAPERSPRFRQAERLTDNLQRLVVSPDYLPIEQARPDYRTLFQDMPTIFGVVRILKTQVALYGYQGERPGAYDEATGHFPQGEPLYLKELSLILHRTDDPTTIEQLLDLATTS